MIDHVLGRPSVKSRRLQVLAVLAFWSAYIYRGPPHGPPLIRFLSKFSTKRLTTWQTVVVTMIYLYAARNFSTLLGLASPEPMSNMYDATYFRATWVLTALDAGFWTAMKIRSKWLRDLASIVFSVFYMFAAERADEKVRKVRGMLTVEHLRVSWNKGTTPYLRFFQGLMRPRFSRWPPRAIRIPRPSGSDYKDSVSAWLYFDGPLTDLARHNRIILDIPGGGFVAMDPRCNDDKLFAWAAKTGMPVLSLDYKKAPEFPYPYALNECFDVYTTIIRSKGRCIGMSGKETPRVVLTGDSAGGNLATSTTLMIIERTSAPMRRYVNTGDLPLPDGLVLFYPGLDMNIGNWMSDEQMSLMKDRRMRGTNKSIIRRKSMQYNELVGTPHQTDDEEDSSKQTTELTAKEAEIVSQQALVSPHPEYSHSGPQALSNTHLPSMDAKRKQSTSHHSEPLRTRLAMSSMISYFNDRVLTPEMMRAMIILYIGPHNRPDFSQDYLLSPVLTPDALLARFPKVYFLTGERDPLVDDTVIFSARLRKVKEAMFEQAAAERSDFGDSYEPVFNAKDVAEVMLIPGISHGFLQFPTVYPPAWKLIDRSADWIMESFDHADAVRERERRGRRRVGGPATNGNNQGRHHTRVESSGDEDWPLEISMTRANRSKTLTKEPQVMDESESIVAKAETNGKINGRTRGSSKSTGSSLVKLKSTDDLLGRRMQGLAGGLTGVGEHD
ncbi:Hormone-sensitive lipase [Colletotrichum sidae]|uniref:Hormone-sensitive lipase n=1 Tax=Colletotrichum sidae TaxID=1347389 RepID=A0A4R8T6W0_9PEZI|nr:Hormone-sensitive lipase [Colletotrichum sidae]